MANGQGSAARFSSPFGIDVDMNSGNIFVADSGNNCIRKITQAGVVSTFSGVCSPGGQEISLDGPSNFARFADLQYLSIEPKTKTLYVTEGGVCLRKVDKNGYVTTDPLGSCGPNGEQISDKASDLTFRLLQGITIGSGGRKFFTDDNCVRSITRDNVISVHAGTCNLPGAENGPRNQSSFNQLIGITIDSDKNLFIADMGNNCIRKIDRTGEVSSLAGSCGEVFNGTMDGVGPNARFQGPWDLELGKGGNLIVADSDNSCIRKVTSKGVVTTLAGICGLRKGLGPFRFPRGVTVY
eukprot:gene5254-18486_t